jgi:hypothetical protein
MCSTGLDLYRRDFFRANCDRYEPPSRCSSKAKVNPLFSARELCTENGMARFRADWMKGFEALLSVKHGLLALVWLVAAAQLLTDRIRRQMEDNSAGYHEDEAEDMFGGG